MLIRPDNSYANDKRVKRAIHKARSVVFYGNRGAHPQENSE